MLEAARKRGCDKFIAIQPLAKEKRAPGKSSLFFCRYNRPDVDTVAQEGEKIDLWKSLEVAGHYLHYTAEEGAAKLPHSLL